MVDSRILQTQSALTKAIFDLASEKPVSEIAVAEVARRAGINRATFYNHYLSPGALLASAVSRELDRVRAADYAQRARAEETTDATTRRTVEAVVALVERNRRMFELTLLDREDASVHRSLCQHFEISGRHILENFVRTHPEMGEMELDVIARFVAEGITGSIEWWLQKPNMAPDRLADAIVSAMPQWFH
ncbi:MAG: hypothetical protein JWQ43_1998 [Glaciihabitans sp.]|nr:hypothetical protein [Glaciihabitans sp.]